ncbi:MAG: 50S ribosomal protein L9 [Bacilli bacterium]|nr:50S ribosomal protein L9 [Bacilli bacterium]MBQ6538698.1 50S ribosomal protein L9 [Bacilli bacterium]
MEVIFIKDLRGQGKKGDIKDVKTGYAENFLIKKGYAVLKTTESLKQLEKEKKEKMESDQKAKDDATKLKGKLDQMTLEFKVKTGQGDKVFGSVSPKQIKEELGKQGIKIEKNMIKLDSSLSTLGFHKVDIELYPKVIAEIKVHLVK